MAKDEKNVKKIKTKEAEDEKHAFIGAIPVKSYVKVKLNGEDKICKIIQVRQDPLRLNDKEPNEYSYEYYIHYENYDRRNDHWIKREEIVVPKISDEEIKKLKNKPLSNDE